MSAIRGEDRETHQGLRGFGASVLGDLLGDRPVAPPDEADAETGSGGG